MNFYLDSPIFLAGWEPEFLAPTYAFFLDSPKVLGGWEPEFLAPTYSKNLVKNTLDFQNAKKNRECTKKYNLHSLRTFSAKVRFG